MLKFFGLKLGWWKNDPYRYVIYGHICMYEQYQDILDIQIYVMYIQFNVQICNSNI